jgi:hypothetical protein
MKGTIFKYTDKEGKEQKAVAFQSEQISAYFNSRKVFLRLLNDDFTEKTNEERKKIVAVKHYNELVQIGFWD